ncbi:cytochrome P450 [Mycolicibacterium moriokaense]|nr:cytochrome P450 [Mycolicibacterium moriokaense]MCV7037852.1 cytochrome P450 [Mycolicibacterium moriokaense]
MSRAAMQSAEGAPPPAGLLDPYFYADITGMDNTFRRWRANGPVYHDEATGVLGVLDHASILHIERHPTRFVNGLGYRSWQSLREKNMIAQDDPEHSRLRGLVRDRFTPRAVQSWEPVIRETVRDLLHAMMTKDSADIVSELAAPLPARLTTKLLGFEEDSWPEIRSWSERLMRIDSLPHDYNVAHDLIEATFEIGEALDNLVPRRRECPLDDVLSVWATSDMTRAAIFDETGLFVSGAAETTRTVISRGLRALCDHPQQWERLAGEPGMIPSAVEELIRWVTPINNFFRTVTTSTSIGAVPVEPGDRIVLLYRSANRDEAVFADAFQFDTSRHPNPHLAFGSGVHFCLGAHLARLQLKVLLEELVRRITALTPLTEPEIEPNIFVSAVRSFKLGYEVR